MKSIRGKKIKNPAAAKVAATASWSVTEWETAPLLTRTTPLINRA
jgi:hypothetical protein